MLEKKMEKNGNKGEPRELPGKYHRLASICNLGGMTIVWSTVFFLSIAWHVIILCPCVKSHPLPEVKLVSEGQMPTCNVLTQRDVMPRGMKANKIRPLSLGHPSQENVDH